MTDYAVNDGFEGFGLLPEMALLVQGGGRPLQGLLPGSQLGL
jgi:hypothetical protein